MAKKIAVVGAGVGGLAVAARLASRGIPVEVFEKLGMPGGRNNIIKDRGFLFDTGPSFVLMPDFFEEVFRYCGRKMEDYLSLAILEKNYKIFYPGGETFTVWQDTQKTIQEMERLEKGAGAACAGFLGEAGRMYQALKPYLYECFTPSSALSPRHWPLLAKLRIFDSYWSLACRYFKSEALRYAFTFEAMFMGVSPFEAPGFYSIISYTDHKEKIRHPMGGMYQVPLALEKLCREFGAGLHYDREVSAIRKKAGGFDLRMKDGSCAFAEQVVVNADYAHAQRHLLGRRLRKYRYSCSVYLLYLGLSRKAQGLEHHNLFFSKDLRKNLHQIFTARQMPEDPSFYVHVPTVTDPGLAPSGKEIAYVLIPVPNMEPGSEPLGRHQQRLKEHVYRTVLEKTGTDLGGLTETEHAFFPSDFITRYNIVNAATFGLAHNLMQSAFFRPANMDAKYRGLYYVGASTQPGGGLPVVLASSRIVADKITGPARL